MSKPKVAFFDFTCCEGCQLQVLSLEDELPEVLALIEIVNFREASSAASEDYQIAVIDGSITRESEIPRIRKIRQQAKVLVTIGACSSTGGINCVKNYHQPMEKVLERVYGERSGWYDVIPARPISAVVPVDYQLPCCPIVKEEFLSLLKALLRGEEPRPPDYPVCAECRAAENVCVYDKGMTCLGPVTRGGCGAECPGFGNYCMGCRGLLPGANLKSARALLEKYGLSPEDVLKAFNLFDGYFKETQELRAAGGSPCD